MNDLKTLSLVELKKLADKIQREIVNRTDQSKKALLKKLQQMAVEGGLDANDIFAEAGLRPTPSSAKPKSILKRGRRKVKPANAKREKSPAIYWNPIDSAQGWNGRGRKPGWVVTYLENGGNLEGLQDRS